MHVQDPLFKKIYGFDLGPLNILKQHKEDMKIIHILAEIKLMIPNKVSRPPKRC